MVSFFLLPLYTRKLTPADYGILELLDLTSVIIITLIASRFKDSLLFFHAAAATEEDRRQTIGSSFYGAVLLGCITAAVGAVFAPLISEIVFGAAKYQFYFRLVLIAFGFGIPIEVCFAYLRALDRATAFAIASLLRLVAAATANIVVLVYFNAGVPGLLWVNVWVSVGLTVYLAIVCKVPFAFDFRLFFKQFRYAAPLGVGGLGMLMIHFGDRFFLRRYVSLSEIGIYALAYKIGMLMTYLKMPFDYYWGAQMFALMRGPNAEKMYVRICTYLTLASCFCLVVMTFMTRPMIHVMAGPSYQSAAALVPWVAAVYVIRTVGTHVRSVFLLENATSIEGVVTALGGVLCVVAYVVLIPMFKVWGAVAATWVAFCGMSIVGYWMAQKKRAFPFERRRLALIAVVTVAFMAAYAAVPSLTFWQDVAVTTVAGCVYPVVLWVLGFLDPDEKRLLRSAWDRLELRAYAKSATNA